MPERKGKAKITSADLRRAIEKGERRPFYLIYGDEGLERERLVDWLVDALTPSAAPDFNVNTFHSDSLELLEFLRVYESYPNLASHRLVILRGCEKLTPANCRDLEVIAESPSSTTILIATGEKVDMRRKLFAVMARLGLATELRAPFENKLPQWIKGCAHDENLTIDPDAIEMLQMVVGPNLRELASEIAKLRTLLGDGGRVSRKIVEEVVAPSNGGAVFELADSIGNRNYIKSQQLCRRLLIAGEEPGRILAMIIRHYRILLKAKDLQEDRSIAKTQLASRLGVPPFFVSRYVDQSRLLSAEELWMGLSVLLEADRRIKSMGRRHQGSIIDLLVQQLCLGLNQASGGRRTTYHEGRHKPP